MPNQQQDQLYFKPLSAPKDASEVLVSVDGNPVPQRLGAALAAGGGDVRVTVHTGPDPTLLPTEEGNTFQIIPTGEIGTEILQLPLTNGEDGQEVTIIYGSTFPGENLTVLRIVTSDAEPIRVGLIPPLSGIIDLSSIDMHDFGALTFRAADGGGAWFLISAAIATNKVTYNYSGFNTLAVAGGASGTFTSQDGKTVTAAGGFITSIV